MNVLTFWLSIFGFTALFGTFILSFIKQKEHYERFRAQYLWYVAISWIWFMLQFIGFVHNTFLDQPNLTLVAFNGIMRALISIVITYSIAALLGSIKHGKVTSRFHWIGLLASLATAVLLIVIIGFQLLSIGPVFTATVNSLIGIAFFGIRVSVRGQQTYRVRRMGSFLVISGTSYLLFGVYAILFLLFPSAYRPVYDALSTALFILAWCVNDVFIFLKELSEETTAEETDSWSSFCESFSLTVREREIVSNLVQGLSYKEIADRLSISPRTVETHVYRIFKKCSVSNKIELTQKIHPVRTNT
ncbi:LuxR C-terminal-related transcriptional regulator [uncultured Sphaerochaeta sp.]|uniref:helix-turn-helix transcriptional regulator n=1 Tax=uncultured Sphaerochaeta sp. TaxID=886478 RepID=UPI002A0A6473|nr:LuxR C-terminal-related transcriptional regulator [uncultured Sphaerochaeta sp.]